jgi:hypothetical protein
MKLMRLVLVLMTEVAGPMVTEGVVDSVEEDREGAKAYNLLHSHRGYFLGGCLKVW